MYQAGDFVVYGIHGVCRIQEIQENNVCGQKKTYYVLQPVFQDASRYMVPLENQAAVSKLRPIATREELDRLLESQEVRTGEWIENEPLRKQRYKELIVSGDQKELLKMIGALLREKEEKQLAGKKLHICDENFLRDAKKLLEGEYAVVFGVEVDKVGQYLAERLVK